MTLPARLRGALTNDLEPTLELIAGDHDQFDDAVTVEQAAVLIAVVDRAEPGVILTRRTDTLRNHAGQIAFPGGRIDPCDASAVAAALREAEEEVALPPASVTVIGAADRYRTVSGFDVTPVIGVVPADLILTPSADEVAEVFEVPLAFLLDTANHARGSIDWRGRERHYYEINWGGYRIWGATAAIIVNLSRRLRWSA